MKGHGQRAPHSDSSHLTDGLVRAIINYYSLEQPLGCYILTGIEMDCLRIGEP